MAETFLSLLLVNSSAKGPSLVFRWPPIPESSSRLIRPLPHICGPELDNPWRAAHHNAASMGTADGFEHSSHSRHDSPQDTDDYVWRMPSGVRDRNRSFSRNTPLPSSGRNSPSKGESFDDECEDGAVGGEYHTVFNYPAQFLSKMLCPQRALCHQKYELIIDNLVFIGHPVSAEDDGIWRFKSEKSKSSSRGRGSRNRDADDNRSERSVSGELRPAPQGHNSWLHMFHFVLVLDLPDPSSSGTGNIAKYFDVIYEHIAFTVTAVLFQEQVLSNFVEAECDVLGALEADYIAKGEAFSEYVSHALQVSSIASAMKTLFESIKSTTMACITLNNLPLELQLPLYLDHLLHNEEEYELDFVDHQEDEEEVRVWGRDLSVGWRLPALAPWKSLLLLDADDSLDPYTSLRGPHVRPEERDYADRLIKFLETASVTLHMASLLDWDLESEVFPTVRWLVHHRRAKLVDVVHSGLKTIFTLSPKFSASYFISVIRRIQRDVSSTYRPSLPSLLATISAASSKQNDNHFFAAVVRSKEHIPLYHDVVLWMLKHDLVYNVHLHVRIVATSELKVRVREAHERKLERLGGRQVRGRRPSKLLEPESLMDRRPGNAGISWLSLSPKSARRYTRRIPSVESELGSEATGSYADQEKDDEDVTEESDEDNVGWGTAEDTVSPSMIGDPGTASPLERKWLAAMSEGKDEHIARRFELINQYFDGKRTD
ncbi:nitrogen permease regulator of amino acid transport activity 3-domain-containing protein [Boletus reticuloceps]|uniref:Nitrogen permease regulator 3 n=1 Tax=Boletus reticuloceps TaxID=495285 RepID=A0A8I2YM39_9AGAM|nr:nitrogen permease regulator of amino acid transport activity 3-domain-containing protein [Boletus reticuloceps]